MPAHAARFSGHTAWVAARDPTCCAAPAAAVPRGARTGAASDGAIAVKTTVSAAAAAAAAASASATSAAASAATAATATASASTTASKQRGACERRRRGAQ